ncbi:hypothetical protein E2C01_071161 [Portunus trituberculatus]|uniref:Uncharacterized protein n=1 Tax=Portunus trituberculatus TaxID=210409 RepID=A0A5B7I398_PORTR|nr:hypothetical protein [Portunus trituberculatus]
MTEHRHRRHVTTSGALKPKLLQLQEQPQRTQLAHFQSCLYPLKCGGHYHTLSESPRTEVSQSWW